MALMKDAGHQSSMVLSSSTPIHTVGTPIASPVLHSKDLNVPVIQQITDSHSLSMQPSLQCSDGVVQCTLPQPQPRPIDSSLLTAEHNQPPDKASPAVQSSTTAHALRYVPWPILTPTNLTPTMVVSPRLLLPMSPLMGLPFPSPDNLSRPPLMSITWVKQQFNGTSQGCTVWYECESFQFPPLCLTASCGELYWYKPTNGWLNCWVMDGMWRTVGEGSSHPTIQGNWLYMHSSGEPSWLTARCFAVQKSKTIWSASAMSIQWSVV